MGLIILRRMFALIFILFGISFIVFFSLHLAPGDPAIMIAGPSATPSELENIRKVLGLDQPLLKQYVIYLSNIIRGDFGFSYQTKQPVVEMLFFRFFTTLKLVTFSMVLATIFGLTAGIVAAIRHNTWIDKMMVTAALLGISLPSFWIGTLLILLFSVKLQWLPVGGLTEPFYTLEGIRQLLLPSLTLAASSAAMISRISRSSMIETMELDYIRTARGKGVSEFGVVFIHALRNVLIPVVTVIGVNFGFLIGGAIITEQVFAINGIGSLIIESISSRDFPVIQGAVLLVAFCFVVINLLVDIIYITIDPRIFYKSK